MELNQREERTKKEVSRKQRLRAASRQQRSSLSTAHKQHSSTAAEAASRVCVRVCAVCCNGADSGTARQTSRYTTRSLAAEQCGCACATAARVAFCGAARFSRGAPLRRLIRASLACVRAFQLALGETLQVVLLGVGSVRDASGYRASQGVL
jgi:hypothetical protein